MNVRRWLPPLLWAGVIIFATSTPADLVPKQVTPFDKAVHFSLYAVLGVLLSRRMSEVIGAWRGALLAVVLAIAFAVVDEWHQQFIPGRSAERADVLADSLGALAGALLYALYSSRRSRILIAR